MATTTPTLTIRTNFTPPVTINPLSKTDATGLRKVLLSLFQPAVDGELPIVGNIHYAPAGDPTGYGLYVMAAIALLAVIGAYQVGRKLL